MATSTRSPNGGNHKTTDRVAASTHEAVDRASEPVGRAEERIRESAEHVAERAHKAADYGRHKRDELTQNVSSYVNEHPIASLGIAFGAGLLVSALLKRR